ncbi:amidohydrolase [Fertoebacter nigrum]|uniref:Amidohydrolase n=1 Tax=Fertoeibacter niger TaxID=2656921 RepID=A0A8X8H4I7_9RHOB|nr:amidohydrolase [Fertoeibacter niger]NUB46229.1 amidohydrolase [Fertoeibacter niger]
MEFIDTHQHLILRDRLGYGWTAQIPALATGDFGLADYHALVAGRGITGTVFMETGVDDADYRAEARLVAGLIGAGGMLGQIASCRPGEAGFAGWMDEAAGLGTVGFRRILHVVPDDVSQTAAFRADLRAIGRAGLSFDMCFLARQLGLARDLARACDDQVLVLDHCGVPDIAGGAFDTWAAGITALADLPHVVCKLSGITAYCAPGTATVALLRQWVDHVLASFGPDRVLWGGDWPVVNLGSGLPGWIDMSRELLAGLSEAERFAVAQGTARRVYRLG